MRGCLHPVPRYAKVFACRKNNYDRVLENVSRTTCASIITMMAESKIYILFSVAVYVDILTAIYIGFWSILNLLDKI